MMVPSSSTFGILNDLSDDFPEITIVMPLYNKEQEVGRAVRSVLAQTFSDFELIVVDDGSTDNGPAIVAASNDSRVRIIRQENSGVSAARNRGIAEAGADIVAFLDADDEWLPEFLATVIRLRANFPSSRVYATSYLLREPDGATCTAIAKGLPAPPWEGILLDYFALAAQSDPPLCASSVAVQKSALEAIGGFPTGIRSGEDLLTWARLAVSFQITYSTTPLAVFWKPVVVSDRPGRFSGAIKDIVGSELASLIATASPSQKPGLRSYLGRWHEMRAIIALLCNRNRDCLRELGNIFTYVKPTGKHILLAMLACLPGSLPARAYQWLKRIRNSRPVRRGMNGTT